MRIFDNFFLDLDNFFYIINKEKESTKMNETVEQTYPARKVSNSWEDKKTGFNQF